MKLLIFMWSKVILLKLPVKEKKMPIADTMLSMAAVWKPLIHAC